MDYKTAAVAIITGGLGGFLFFYFLLKPILHIFHKIKQFIYRIIPEYFKKQYSDSCTRWFAPRKKAYFSRRSRLIVRIKKSYGMWGPDYYNACTFIHSIGCHSGQALLFTSTQNCVVYDGINCGLGHSVFGFPSPVPLHNVIIEYNYRLCSAFRNQQRAFHNQKCLSG